MPPLTAEVDHRRHQFAELTQQVQRLRCQTRHELELVPVTAALKLHLDSAHLFVERKSISLKRIGGEKQDGVLGRSRRRRRATHIGTKHCHKILNFHARRSYAILD
jgi:hypothetical protein